MRTTQQFSITLPNEMAGLVKSRVATGAYQSPQLNEYLKSASRRRDKPIDQVTGSIVGKCLSFRVFRLKHCGKALGKREII